MPSKYRFPDRAHLIKEETEKALEKPEWLVGMMREHHESGDGPQPLQIRLGGNIRDAMTLANHLCEALGTQARVRKNEIDRNDGIGNSDADNIRVYLDYRTGEVRDHDETAEATVLRKRLTCPKCHLLLSVAETRRGRCGSRGSEF